MERPIRPTRQPINLKNRTKIVFKNYFVNPYNTEEDAVISRLTTEDEPNPTIHWLSSSIQFHLKDITNAMEAAKLNPEHCVFEITRLSDDITQISFGELNTSYDEEIERLNEEETQRFSKAMKVYERDLNLWRKQRYLEDIEYSKKELTDLEMKIKEQEEELKELI